MATQEEVSLNDEDRRNGFVLTCISKPVSDIVIDAEDLKGYGLTDAKTIPSKIKELLFLNEDMVQVSLRLPPNQKPDFLEGQYLNVIRGGQKRSYSISNSSSDSEFQLLIKKVAGGVFSEYWFTEAKTNDLLRLEVPVGTFFLRNHPEIENLIFVATGSGIAPIKAILEGSKSIEKLKSFKRIIVIWGLKNEESLFWTPTGNVEFHTVYSKEIVPKKYVQDFLVEMDLELKKSVVYACGMDEMINDLKLKLRELPKDQFFSDSFVKSS